MRSLTLSKNWFQVSKQLNPILSGSLKKDMVHVSVSNISAAVSETSAGTQEVTANLEDFYLVIENFEQNVQEIETIANILKFQVDSFKF